jgi:hypothetical protein
MTGIVAIIGKLLHEAWPRGFELIKSFERLSFRWVWSHTALPQRIGCMLRSL